MEARLPALAAPFSRTWGLTCEILRRPEMAEALHRGLAELATQFGPEVGDRVYVRIPLGAGWLEGWYAPAESELEPIAWVPVLEAA